MCPLRSYKRTGNNRLDKSVGLIRLATTGHSSQRLLSATCKGRPLNYVCLGGGETGNKLAVWKSRFIDPDFEKIKPAIVAAMIVAKRSSSNSDWSKSISETSSKDAPTTLDMGKIAWLPKQRQKAKVAKVIRKQSCLTIFWCNRQNFQNKKTTTNIWRWSCVFFQTAGKSLSVLTTVHPKKLGATPHRSNYSLQHKQTWVNYNAVRC